MLRTSIINYLADPGTYNDGLSLLESAGQSSAALRVKGRGVLPQDRERLHELLQQVLDQLPVSLVDVQQEPAAIRKLRDRGRRLMKEQAYLHAQLVSATNDDDRYQLADQIMGEVIPRIDEVYNTLRHYEATGEAPAEIDKQAIVAETIEKMKKRDSLKSLIRRAKKRLATERLTLAMQRKIEQEKADREAELEALERELGV